MSEKNRIRLYTNAKLFENANIELNPLQAHYLNTVLRLSTGDKVYVFNNISGEFETTITKIGKKNCALKVLRKIADYTPCPDIMLLFAPLKKDATEYLIQKAVELGVSVLQPVITEYTNTKIFREQRALSCVIEAAEQSRRTDLPKILPLKPLSEILSHWDNKRALIYLDETGSGQSFSTAAPKAVAPAALLVGPEGGFSEKELAFLKKQNYSIGVSLGKRILRAETAAAAGLACWQALCGDWLS